MNIPVIVGPTAAGKTAVAVQLAEMTGGEIISADSRQIFRNMEVGTGAPSSDEMQRVPHHLVGIIQPDRLFSAGEFARLAHEKIKQIMSRDRIPFIVGGSGLYIRALVDGLSPIPPSDPDVITEIEAEIDQRGMVEMIAELKEVDPDYGRKVGIHDRKRLSRALAVWRMTGRSFTDWHRDTNTTGLENVIMLGLTRPRSDLWKIIEKRIHMMINSGWMDEVQFLIQKYGGIHQLPPPVTEGLGYKEIIAMLNGTVDLETTIERIAVKTRQFAKRQMTWFRADSRIEWSEQAGDDAVDNWVTWGRARLSAAGKHAIT